MIATRTYRLLAATILTCSAPVRAHESTLELLVQTGHTNTIDHALLDRSGQYLVTASYDSSVILWNAQTGAMLRTFRHKGSNRNVSLSGDGKLLVTAFDNEALLWNTRSGAQLRTFKGPSTSIFLTGASLSLDGRYLATATSGPEIILWDAQTGKKIRTFWGIFNCMSLSPDGKYLATGSRDKTASLWNTENGFERFTLRGHEGIVTNVHFSADGRLLSTESDNRSATVWNVETGDKLRTFQEHKARLTCARLSPDGKSLATGSSDKVVTLWNAATGEAVHNLRGHADEVRTMTWSGDGKYVATGSYDKSAVLWDARSGERVRTFRGLAAGVKSVSHSADGRYAAIASNDFTAVLWDTNLGIRRGGAIAGHSSGVHNARLSHDGNVMLIGSSDQTFMLWDIQAGKSLSAFQVPSVVIWSVTLSGDGRQVAFGTRDGSAILLDARTREVRREFRGHSDTVGSVSLTADGRYLATGSGDKTAILWDAHSGAKLHTFQGHTSSIRCVSISPDANAVATGSYDNTAVIWNAQSGEKRQTLVHASFVDCVTWSSDGKYLATGCSDHMAVLWNAKTGDKIRTFRGHGSAVDDVSLSADRKYLWTCSRDGTTRIWEVDTGRELCSLISIDAGKEWLVVTPEGLFDGSPDATRLLLYRISGTLDVVPLERYQQKYWRPGLFAQIMRGEKPEPVVNINKTLPPKVRFADSLKPGAELRSAKLAIEAIAETRSEYPVKAFRLLVDGRPYRGQQGVFKLPEPKLGESRAKWDVELEPGRHTLKVMVDTEYVQGASDEIEVKYVAAAPAVELPSLYVLAIGISDYADATRKLDFAHLDAAALAESFKAYSKALFKDIDTRVVTDKDATRKGVFAGMQWLREKMAERPYSVGVMFFAGHGEKDKSDGSLYLLPVDFEEKDLAGSAIDADTLKKQLASIHTDLKGKLMLILDACHSGEIGKEKTRSAGELTDQLVRDLTAEENGLIVYASALGHQKAQESREFKHGMFTQALIEALSGKAGKTADGAVYLDSLIAYVNGRVRDLTKGYQSPVPGRPIAVRDFPISKP